MAATTDFYTGLPPWLLRYLPTNSVHDPKLAAKIDKLGQNVLKNLEDLMKALGAVAGNVEYDDAANRACTYVWRNLEVLFQASDPYHRCLLLQFTQQHFLPIPAARILRRLAKDSDYSVRHEVRHYLDRHPIQEVALPAEHNGPWDSHGWSLAIAADTPVRYPHGAALQSRRGLPPIANVKQLRDLLGIRTSSQLGYLLLASEGPYRTFTIPKRDGSLRQISAPAKPLRFVQRQILQKILDLVPAHDAAHGFIAGRSTVTNAAPHLRAALLIKFDLQDFFPTIHYHRVVGLFGSLGYPISDGRFSSRDKSPRVAPTLARLCTFKADSTIWAGGVTPQGAPTSPAISNLVCRGLDARLHGLAQKLGGVYTRYADDLTFSFPRDDVNVGRFRWWVDQICHQEGFLVHEAKFRVIRPSQRQCVTGIVVNEVLHVPRDQRRKFRAMLHNCRTHGVASQIRDNPGFASYLQGFASYLNMVQADDGPQILREVKELLARPDRGGAP